ncbi:MAG: cation transporter [Kiritimatiellae bacterium]|nr:cation transporter [Kiritimatiellia bacterium]
MDKSSQHSPAVVLPRGITGRLIRWALPAGAVPTSTEGRTRLGELEGYVSTAISAVLAAFKGVLGALTGSVSLIADAINNATDIASSLLIALACRWSRKPRDEEHPFGHGRAETIATLVLSFCLILVSMEVGRAGIERLWSPKPLQVPVWTLWGLGLTVAIKAWLALFARRVARLSRSVVIEADAWNHLFDILSTLLVLIALLGARAQMPRLDGWAGIGVAVFILWTGARFARRATHTLIGAAPDPAEMRHIRAIACSVPGVRGVHDLLIHAYGDLKLVSLHIEVDAHLTVMDAHTMAEHVEAEIARALDYRSVTHVDPVDRTHPAYGEAEQVMQRLTERHPELSGFHDLRLSGTATRYDLSVDLVAHGGVAAERFEALLAEMKDEVHGALPGADRVDLGLETELASEHEQRRIFHR